MVGIILASHGEFANGILQSGAMIFGDQVDVKAVTLQPSEGPDDLKAKMEAAIATFENQDEVLFLVDLWGGTPFNQANGLIAGHEDKWAIVTGLNLPMLIETYASRMSMETAHEIAKHVTEVAREGVKVKPEELEPETKVAAQAINTQSQGAIPEGTVLGDGHIKYVLARIDTRLLHGQVATTWTKTTQPNRIIVVSDAVSKDILNSILASISRIDYIKPDEIPGIDLYMDQVTTFMENHLSSSKRHPEDKVLTKTMINNYAKNHLLPPPVKKKYSREHILMLTIIYYFKNIMSINDIQVLLGPIAEEFFPGNGSLKLQEVYQEIMDLELEQIDPLIKYVTKKFNKARSSFSNADEKEQDFLQKFAFICMLSFDVYVKKQVIENLIDQMATQDSSKNQD